MVPAVRRGLLVVSLLVLAACGGPKASGSIPTPSPTAGASSTPTATPAPSALPTATPTATPASTPTPGGAPSAGTASCTPPGDPGHNLVLGTIQGSSATVIRDITNASAAVSLPCTFAGRFSPR